MVKRRTQRVDRDVEAVRLLERGGIARIRLFPDAARRLGTPWAYAVPSRSLPNVHYYAHPTLGCECDDWKYRQPVDGCAHMRAAGEMERRDRARKAARRQEQAGQ